MIASTASASGPEASSRSPRRRAAARFRAKCSRTVSATARAAGYAGSVIAQSPITTSVRLNQLRRDAHGLGLFRWAEEFRVDDAREYLRAFDDARAGSAEVARGVDGPDFSCARCGQLAEAARQTRTRERADDLLLVEAAGREHYDFGRVSLNLFGGGRPRLAARVAERGVAARKRDLFGNPVAGRKRRLKPFEDERARSDVDARERGGERVQARRQTTDERLGLPFPARQRADRADVREDVLNRLRFERDDARLRVEHARGPHNGLVADGADLAKLLRDDEVWIKLGLTLLIKLVDRAVAVELRADGVGYLGARHL